MIRALVTACDLNFVAGAHGLLRSVHEFHPDVACYCLCPADSVEAVRAELGTLATVMPAPRTVRGVPDHWKLQLLAARVFIPILPADVTAWVDCDAIFCRAAPELWNVTPGRVHVIRDAVYNLGRMVPTDIWTLFSDTFGVEKTDCGFNAGVYALRNRDWHDLPERYEQALEKLHCPYYPPGFDQALLNGILRPALEWLPASFNAHATFEVGIPYDLRILHYTGDAKPWMRTFAKFQESYFYWLRYAKQERRWSRLAPVLLYIQLNRPLVFSYKMLRKILTILGFWPHNIGVSNGTFLAIPSGNTAGDGKDVLDQELTKHE